MQSLKRGDIGFTMRHGNILSRLMAWFMCSRFSHAFLILGACDEYTMILEATEYGVQFGYLEKYLEMDNCSLEVWSPMDLSDDIRMAIWLAAMRTYHEMYGFLQLPSFGLRALLAKLHIRIRNFIRMGIVCDELVLTGYNASTLPVLSWANPKSLQTGELYELVAGSGSFERVFARK